MRKVIAGLLSVFVAVSLMLLLAAAIFDVYNKQRQG